MTNQRATAKRNTPRFSFISETIDELKKVAWLSRREAAYLTALVLIISISVGIVLGVIDYGFTQLVNRVFLGG